MKLSEHPTITKVRSQGQTSPDADPIDSHWLRRICLEAGIDDVGFVSIERPELDDQRKDILKAFPETKTLLSLVCKLNREAIRTPFRSVGNLEFHQSYEHLNESMRHVVRQLQEKGIRSLNPASGFPMEMDSFLEKSGLYPISRSR